MYVCVGGGQKTTVRQLLADEQPNDEHTLLVLEDHALIVRDGEHWRLRVPLFEAWVRRYQVG